MMLPDHVRAVVDGARALPAALPSIVAVGLAGSWARGAGRPDSDVDLVVLTSDPADVLSRTDWFPLFGPAAELIRSQDFGAIQERRLRLADATVVEVGIGAPSWVDLCPVGAGTRRVVADGFVVLHDPSGLLAAVTRAVRQAPVGGTPGPSAD